MFPPLAPKGMWTLRRSGRTQSVKVAGAIEIDDMDAVHAAVISGLGLGILPLFVADDGLRNEQLRRVLPPFEAAGNSSIYLVYAPNRTLSFRVRTVIDFLLARFGSTPPWEPG